MVTIYTNGSIFQNEIEQANLISGFKRDSYLVEYKKNGESIFFISPMNGIFHVRGESGLLRDGMNALWYLNLKLGGISAEEEIAEEAKRIFEEDYLGSTRKFTSNGNQATYLFEEGKRKRALFAGGCFWCISMPFYDTKGVLAVKSGYAGGDELSPTYLSVKHQETHHKECILIEYDSSIVDYERILEVFFENIDPFDTEGQYIDRGASYAPAIYTSDKEERARVIEYKYQLSDECERSCLVPLNENCPFFLAEEEHQDYAIKHPEEMEKELIASGRKKI